jgi:iron complex outermembrane receptor protein
MGVRKAAIGWRVGRPVAAALMAACVGAIAPGAAAQESGKAGAPSGTASAPAVPAAAKGPVTLSPIQVQGQTEAEGGTAWSPVKGFVAERSASGTKTDTPILTTPQSISVISRDEVQSRGDQGLTEALKYTSGVMAGQFGFDTRGDWILVRGFAPDRYLDGMLVTPGVFSATKVEPYGLERIEVLRGPASLLYGQAPPGGLINMVSLRPEDAFGGEVGLTTGSHNRLQGEGDVTGRIDKDGKFLYRLTALGRSADTQIDHVKDKRAYVAPSLTWRPTADTTLTVLGFYLRDRIGSGIQFLPSQGTLRSNPNGRVPRGRFVGEPGYDRMRREEYAIGYLFEHRFNDVWTVRQNLRYLDVDLDYHTIFGGGLQADMRTLNRNLFLYLEDTTAFNVDNQAQAQFGTGPLRHTVLVGVDYRRVHDVTRQGGGAGPTIDIFDPHYGAAIADPAITAHTAQTLNQVGIYAQDQIGWDRWLLTLTGRHDWVDSVTRNRIAGTRTDQDDHRFSSRVGLNYLFDFGVSPYVAFAQSFQPTLGAAFNGTPFKPTVGKQYEAGVKYQPNGLDALFTLAAFHLTQKNALTPDTAAGRPVGFSVQTGEARVKGIELEGRANLRPGFSVVGAYALTDSEVTKSNGPNKGKHLVQVPTHMASAWADYTIQRGVAAGLGFGAGVRYTGRTWGDPANALRIPGYTLFDAAVHYDFDRWRFAVNASNLFDKRYVATCGAATTCYYGNSRLVLVTATYRFGQRP